MGRPRPGSAPRMRDPAVGREAPAPGLTFQPASSVKARGLQHSRPMSAGRGLPLPPEQEAGLSSPSWSPPGGTIAAHAFVTPTRNNNTADRAARAEGRGPSLNASWEAVARVNERRAAAAMASAPRATSRPTGALLLQAIRAGTSSLPIKGSPAAAGHLDRYLDGQPTAAAVFGSSPARPEVGRRNTPGQAVRASEEDVTRLHGPSSLLKITYSP